MDFALQFEPKRQFATATARFHRVIQLNGSVFVERLLEADGPIWHRWDRDASALLDALTTAIKTEFASTADPPSRDHERLLRRRRLCWLLDRVAPASNPELFVPYGSEETAIYGWGRRLTSKRRNELTEFQNMPDVAGNRDRRMTIQALMLAWCDTCPDNELDSILNWAEFWRPVLKQGDICWLHAPEDEYYRRSTDIQRRYHPMLNSLRKSVALLSDADETIREIARTSSYRLLRYLLRDVAIQNPAAVPFHTTAEQYQPWMDDILSSSPFADITNAGGELLKSLRERATDEYVARSLWIWLHGKGNWEQLYSVSGMFRHDWISGQVLDRLAEIVPEDELETWGTLVTWDSDDSRIRAFCRWLPPKYADVLRDHFNHPDRDWGACAYQNYLSKAQEPILRLMWSQSSDLTKWQAELLDRRLSSPEAVHPAAVVEDIQTVEGDLRLQDPFNHRCY